MKFSEIQIFNIGRTQVDKNEVRKWLDFLGTDYQPPDTTDPTLLIALAAKRCYMSFEPGLNPNVTKVRSDLIEYTDNILKSGHGSVLEHSVYTFAIENVSRVFTAEMNRHRAGWAISEGSLRYIRFDDIKFWLPESLMPKDTDDKDTKIKKQKTAYIFEKAICQDEYNYKELCEIWGIEQMTSFTRKKELTSLFRRIIPLGVSTGGVWTGNLRALRHVITMRAAPEAEEEICYVFSRIAKMMVEKEPLLFKDFTETKEGFWTPKYRKV